MYQQSSCIDRAILLQWFSCPQQFTEYNACLLQRTLDFRKNENEKMKEDVSVNVKENYVIYHVNDDDTDVSVMQDFNRVSIDWISE